MNTGQIYKSKQSGNFTVIPNSILEDQRLSLKAIGLLCYILKLPPDWVINKSSLHKNLKDGRDLVVNAFTELEKAGYIIRQRICGKSGAFIGYNYEVFDVPASGLPKPENPETVKPKPEKPITGNPKSGNPALLKKKGTKKDIPKLSFLPNGKNVGDHGSADKKPEGMPEDPPPDTQKEKKPSTYTRFIAVYSAWYFELNKVKPKLDGTNGEAAKSLIVYFRSVVRDKAREENETITDEQAEERLIVAWQFLFKCWGKLSTYLQGKTRLIDINSEIPNMITAIKNGHTKVKQREQTGGEVSTAGLASSIAKHYSGAGAAKTGQ
jgi:hypothetical protein